MSRVIFFACAFTVSGINVSAAHAEELEGRLRTAVAEAASEQRYELRYQFQAGETLRYRVEHLATVDTRIDGNSQETKSRSVSTKVWRVTEASPKAITFTYSIADVDMWQKTSGRQEVRYNSRSDQNPPSEYEHVAKSLGEVLATITMDRTGKILSRSSATSQPDLGFGGIVVPFPQTEIKVGQTWNVPDTVRLRQRDGRVKEVLIRLRYRLEKVQTGVATISISTQVLTPLNNPQLKSQLVQRLSRGEIKFDLEAGRMISKQLDWDEDVIGFSGPGSNMKYLARFTETLIADMETANVGAAPRNRR